MGSSVLGEAIGAIRAWSTMEVKGATPGSAESFGSLVFNDSVQQARLAKPAYQALRRTITHGDPLDASAADAVAKAMKEWAIEPGESYAHAALREAHEEIALDPVLVRIAGALTPIDIPVSGFRLHPIVGLSDARPPLHPADGEVARILDIALDELAAPASIAETTREREGRRIDAPAFAVAGEEIWGATAMVLAEFLSLVGWSRR